MYCVTDIDECNDPSKNVCDHICVNTEGGYRCDCHSGFLESSEGTCTGWYEIKLQLFIKCAIPDI